ncbi:MAG TPA: PEP-CTERM sorting domain-containing protein [Kiritimatiellia bacterium]|nr:PEP-CTERM sorting domain-containing protein [Kiritimatiellia bacterium]
MSQKRVWFVSVLAAMGLVAGLARGDLIWLNSVIINDFSGNPLPASETDPTAGAFAQLIQITLGSTPSSFVGSGNGTSGNDVVVQIQHAGQGDDLFEPGIFPGLQYSVNVSGFYYVRVFDAPQLTLSAWNQGVSAPIPSGAGYYYQSAVFEYSHNEFAPTPIFDFASAGGQTLNVVPEPTVVSLLAVGLAVFSGVRRRLARAA